MKQDSFFDVARVFLTRPASLRSYEPILLLSHMRANTSLLGHILGDNPAINGYYELHIGYYSWRSLLRQKYRFFSRHRPKPRSRYLFDKILHNDHEVDLQQFNTGKLVFSLRPPDATIPSIMALYSTLPGPPDPCASLEGASRYYLQRLETLEQLGKAACLPYCYLDADALRQAPEPSLSALTDFLELDIPLRQEYQRQPLTGERRAGDTSADIHSGSIQRGGRIERETLPNEVLTPLQEAYDRTRASLTEHRSCALTIAADGVVRRPG